MTAYLHEMRALLVQDFEAMAAQARAQNIDWTDGKGGLSAEGYAIVLAGMLGGGPRDYAELSLPSDTTHTIRLTFTQDDNFRYSGKIAVALMNKGWPTPARITIPAGWSAAAVRRQVQKFAERVLA